jgi:hypothetical protein
MMSGTLEQNNKDRNITLDNQAMNNNEDEFTEVAGANRRTKDRELREIHVKWQMPGNQDVVAAKKQLIQLLASLLVNHPDDIIIIDKKQREWSYHEDQEEEKFLKEFEKVGVHMHPMRNKQKKVIRWIAITKIRSMSTIQDWKNNDHFYSHATEMKTYLFPHPFGEDEWEIMNIGFIKDIHAVHYPRELLKEQLLHLIQKQEKNPPTFQLIPQRITTNDKQASTKAYTVQCLRSDAAKLIHLLTHGAFRETNNQVFVPFKYKTSKPEVFTKCIRQQNDVYYKTWIIKVEGITSDIMSYLEREISGIMGVLHIVPSKRVEEIGEWKLLTEQSKCAYIHKQLSAKWKDMVNQIPPTILDAAPESFSTPRISSQRARDYQDSESDNDSYGSLLTTGTDHSVLQFEEESLNELPPEYKYPTYAAATMASTQESGDDTQMSSPTNSSYADWQKEKQELKALILNQSIQIERIQADLQAKVSRSKELEDKLAQAIELADSRDKRHEEMLAKLEFLMEGCDISSANIQDSVTGGDREQEPPTTPARKQGKGDPPPPKKANTNASPNRIYAMFRQQQQRQNIPRYTSGNLLTIKRRTTPNPIILPMDTDDADHPPPPDAQSGQQQE